MLRLRPSRECCDEALAPEPGDARICSFECAFCASRAKGVLDGRCPNCGGDLVVRPKRPANKLATRGWSFRVVEHGIRDRGRPSDGTTCAPVC